MESIVPLISHFISMDQDDNDLKGSDFDELKESCLQAFEALVVRCFREITPHIGAIVKTCLSMLSHDPNYDYGTDDEMEEDSMDTEDYDE